MSKEQPIRFLTYRDVAFLRCISTYQAFLEFQGNDNDTIASSVEAFIAFLMPRVHELLEQIPDIVAYDVVAEKPKNLSIPSEHTDTPLPVEQPCVYIVGLHDQPEMFKIGITTDLVHRISGISNGNPFKPYLVKAFYVDDPRSIERELHRQFSGKRIHREWFRLSDADVIDAIDAADAFAASEGEKLA